MISDRECAAELAKAGEGLIAEIFKVVEPSQSGTPSVTSEDARRRLVKLIGTLETELIGPLYKQYPDLEPPHLRKNAGS
jgi:hypothetical protein